MELPELQGTEKQIAWANTLRQALVDEISSLENYEKLIKGYGKLYKKERYN